MQEKCEMKFPVDKYSFICLNTLYLHAKMGIVALPKIYCVSRGCFCRKLNSLLRVTRLNMN